MGAPEMGERRSPPDAQILLLGAHSTVVLAADGTHILSWAANIDLERMQCLFIVINATKWIFQNPQTTNMDPGTTFGTNSGVVMNSASQPKVQVHVSGKHTSGLQRGSRGMAKAVRLCLEFGSLQHISDCIQSCCKWTGWLRVSISMWWLEQKTAYSTVS